MNHIDPRSALDQLQDKLQKKVQKKISILLLRFPGPGPQTFSLWTRFRYTHASIGLMEEDKNTFYSFANTGFRVEKLTRYIRPDWKPLPCQLYEIPVSEDAYERIQAILQSFVERKPNLQYSKLGVLMVMLQIPHKWKNRYFCSQFVAEVLREARAVPLKKDPSLYVPKDFIYLPQKELVFQGTLPDMVDSFGISAAAN